MKTSRPLARPALLAAPVTLAAAGLALAFAPRAARAQAPAGMPPMMPPPSISVSATGEEQVTPDRARLTLGVQTQAPTAAEASSRNARLQRAVLDTLHALGIPSEQITTSGFNVYPETEYNQQTRKSRITGYNVQNTVMVEIRRIEQVGPVLDAVLAKGANNAGGLQFYSSQAEAVRRRALARAVERARLDAEAIATAAGGHLGDLLEVGVGGDYQPPRPMMAMSRAVSADAATPISEGTQTVSASVSARWRFVSGR